jgi:DNA replication protein DnaC
LQKAPFRKRFCEQGEKIKAKTHLDFLTQLFTAEIEERDRKRRNLYIHAAKFDILKTFEDYTFEDIKFPQALSTDDLMSANYVPKHENLILYGTVGAGQTHLAVATGIAACDAGTCKRADRGEKKRRPIAFYEAV